MLHSIGTNLAQEAGDHPADSRPPSEVTGLHWSDVDLEAGSLKITTNRVRPHYEHGCSTPCGRTPGHCTRHVQTNEDDGPTKSSAGGIPAEQHVQGGSGQELLQLDLARLGGDRLVCHPLSRTQCRPRAGARSIVKGLLRYCTQNCASSHIPAASRRRRSSGRSGAAVGATPPLSKDGNGPVPAPQNIAWVIASTRRAAGSPFQRIRLQQWSFEGVWQRVATQKRHLSAKVQRILDAGVDPLAASRGMDVRRLTHEESTAGAEGARNSVTQTHVCGPRGCLDGDIEASGVKQRL